MAALLSHVDIDDDTLVDDTSSKNAKNSPPVPSEIHMHPLVLLSAVDHFVRINNRVSSGKRVVGILLGEKKSGNVLDVNNSFAVPFEEDVKDPDVWFLDGNYIQEMFSMVRKVWSRTKIVGWYSSGPKICPNDLVIHDMIRTYCPNPVYCIIDVDPKEEGHPTASYACVDRVEDESSSPKPTFTIVRTVLSAIEAEEIGVEQMLRDLTDSTVSTLSTRIKDRQSSLCVLHIKLKEIRDYLHDVMAGKMRLNHEILYQIQEIFNALPNIHRIRNGPSMIREINDVAVATFVGSLVRCLLAIDALISNKKSLQKLREKKENEKKENDNKASKAEETAPASTTATNTSAPAPKEP